MSGTTLPFRSNRTPVIATRGLVASTEPLATAAGLEVLAAGGNAADAAIATAAALGVVEPNNTGLGGDCFCLYFDAGGDPSTRRVHALNASGRAPAALTLERALEAGLRGEIPRAHPFSVTVPGACSGWFALHARFGTRPMGDLLSPAIRLADEGFPVAALNALLWDIGARSQLAQAPGGDRLMIDGRAPRAGERFRNPDLAATLRRLAQDGARAYYEGPIGEAVVAAVRGAGGVLAESDLAAHAAEWVEPISTVYRGLRVWECPPNGQGLAALLALNLLRGFELAGQDPVGPDRFHLMIEAMRLAFADARWYVADPARVDVPVDELLSEAYAAERRETIDPARANPEAERGTPFAGSDTVYFAVADAFGNACSFINSNYQSFGTGIVPPGTGFSLQNRGSGFSLEADHPNVLAPGKRPYHTIIPGMLTRESDGSLFGPFGVMGGFAQPQGHLQVVVAMADDGADPQAALDRPRFQIPPGTARGDVHVEVDLPEATVDALAERGHAIVGQRGLARVLFGRGQILRREPDGVLWGGTDPRADGCVMTF